MAAPVCNPALGTTFSRGIASVYTAIGLITSIDGPESEMGTAETTHLTSTAKTYRKTLFDGAEVSIELEFDPKGDGHSTLLTLFYTNTQAATGEQWKITFADAAPSTATFLGIITKFGPSKIEPESNLMASMTVKITGLVTWA